MGLLRRSRGRVECPMTGCRKVLEQNALYDDTMLERSVERAMEEERLRTEQTEVKQRVIGDIATWAKMFFYSSLT